MTSIRTCGPLGLLLLAALALPLAGLFPASAHAEDQPATEPVPEGAHAHVPWVNDFEKAKSQAATEKKDLLINFTGSDWCRFCKMLEGEVIGQKEFLDAMSKHYVFVFLDFPNAADLKAKVVDPALNERLKNEYKVGGFPTLVLASADGKPYGFTGYRQGGPKPYLEHMEEMRANSAAILALANAGAENATPAQLKAGFEPMIEQGVYKYGPYEWVVESARKADPNGSLGLKKHLDRLDEEAELQNLMPKRRGEAPDWPKVIALIKRSKYLSGPNYVNIGYHCANLLLKEQNKPEEAKALGEKIGKDPIFQEDEGAKTAITKFFAECDAAIDAAKSDADGDSEDSEDGGK